MEQYLAFVGGKPLAQIVSPPAAAVAVKAVQQPAPIISGEPFSIIFFFNSSIF